MKASVFVAILLLLLSFTRCSQTDCSSIDVSKVRDIELPRAITPTAATLEDLMQELDHHLHKTFRLIMRCHSENDFQQDKVLPSVMLWISDSWELRNDTSKLGLIFYQHGIDPWERARVTGVLYNRHLNEKPLFIPALLEDARIRTEYGGRIASAETEKQLDEVQRGALLTAIRRSDSMLNRLSVRELGIPRADRLKHELDKRIGERYALMKSLGDLIDDIATHQSGAPHLKALADEGYGKSLTGFDKLTTGQKLILIESIRMDILQKENNDLDRIKPLPSTARITR